MEWAREFRQHPLFLKIDFDKTSDHIDWKFIIDMFTFIGFGQHYVGMVNTLFACAFDFVLVNNLLSTCICIHRSMRKECPLAPYLYVLTVDSLGYLLEATCLQGWLKVISLPGGRR
jgi:hypothetical protein